MGNGCFHAPPPGKAATSGIRSHNIPKAGARIVPSILGGRHLQLTRIMQRDNPLGISNGGSSTTGCVTMTHAGPCEERSVGRRELAAAGGLRERAMTGQIPRSSDCQGWQVSQHQGKDRPIRCVRVHPWLGCSAKPRVSKTKME